MTHWTRRIPFKVDVVGVIEIMGTSLYSRADTPIRELIQNAHDAVVRRRHRDLTYQGRIDIEQDAVNHQLRFHDDGIGLTPAEAEKYLSTLGIGITGLLKKNEVSTTDAGSGEDTTGLIGQFGIGLFSAFMLADQLTVESRHIDADEAIRWQAGAGTDIELSSCERTHPGTTVTLTLKPQYHSLAENAELVERAIKEFADFVRIPIFLNRHSARVNVINAVWFDPSPEREALEMELESYFGETPLDIIPLRLEKPAALAGALYVTPERTPGFSGDAVVTVTLRRMVISRHIQNLIPAWAPFLRGVLELPDCPPTASREDLVRDERFTRIKKVLEQKLFEHFEQLADKDPARLESILAWHRYHFAGAALDEPRLRQLVAPRVSAADVQRDVDLRRDPRAKPGRPARGIRRGAHRLVQHGSPARRMDQLAVRRGRSAVRSCAARLRGIAARRLGCRRQRRRNRHRPAHGKSAVAAVR